MNSYRAFAIHYITEPDEHISVETSPGAFLILRRGQGDLLFDALAWKLIYGGQGFVGAEDKPRRPKPEKGTKLSLTDLGL